MSYRLINPNIDNNLFTSKEKKPDMASAEIWGNLAQNIKGFVPDFHYSIQNVADGSIHHYRVNEKDKDNQVSYNIIKLKNPKIDKSNNMIVQQGGYSSSSKNRHNDDNISLSSSSSVSTPSSFSSSSSYNNLVFNTNRPVRFTYYPAIYGIEDIFIPTFSTKLYGNVNPSLKIVIPIDNAFNNY
jgi:hypothetical protein